MELSRYCTDAIIKRHFNITRINPHLLVGTWIARRSVRKIYFISFSNQIDVWTRFFARWFSRADVSLTNVETDLIIIQPIEYILRSRRRRGNALRDNTFYEIVYVPSGSVVHKLRHISVYEKWKRIKCAIVTRMIRIREQSGHPARADRKMKTKKSFYVRKPSYGFDFEPLDAGT